MDQNKKKKILLIALAGVLLASGAFALVYQRTDFFRGSLGMMELSSTQQKALSGIAENTYDVAESYCLAQTRSACVAMSGCKWVGSLATGTCVRNSSGDTVQTSTTDDTPVQTTTTSLAITGPISLPNGTVGQAYPPTQITATGGTGTKTFHWSFQSAESNPQQTSGLSLSSAGQVAGTPSLSGTFVYLIIVKDGANTEARRKYTIIINPAAGGTTGLQVTSDMAFTGGERAAGSSQVQLAVFVLTNTSSSDVTITAFKVMKEDVGTPAVSNAKLKNLKLLQGSAPLGNAIAQLDSSGAASWLGLSVPLGKGMTTKFTLIGDIDALAEAGGRFHFRINRDQITVNPSVTLLGSFPISTSDIRIPAATGGLRVTEDPALLGTQEIAQGTENFTVASYLLENTLSRDVRIVGFRLYRGDATLPEEALKDFQIDRGGGVRSGAVQPAGGFAVWPDEAITVQAGGRMNLLIKGSVDDDATPGATFQYFATAGSIVSADGPILGLDPGSRLFTPMFRITGNAAAGDGATGDTVPPPTLTLSRSADSPPATTRPQSTDWFTATKLQFSSTSRAEIDRITVSVAGGPEDLTVPPSKIDKVQLFTAIGSGPENQLSAAQSLDANGKSTFLLAPARWILDDSNLVQKLIIKVKLKSDADRGKKFALGIQEAADIHLVSGSVANVNFPAMGNDMTIQQLTALNCENGKIEEGGACVCPAGKQEFTGGTSGTFYSPDVCVPCTVAEIISAGGFYCPADKPAEQPPSNQNQNNRSGNQPPASGSGSTPPAQTCEQQGKFTYTGPEKPGVRTPGMCIDCPTATYVKNDGKCEVKKSAKKTVSQTTPPTTGTSTPGEPQRQAAQSGTPQRGAADRPSLTGSQRLVRAPERGNTGPGVAVYFGALALTQAAIWLRKKLKR